VSTTDPIRALCLSCATVRTVSGRYIGRGERRLKCITCRVATVHGSAIGRRDFREEMNERARQRDRETWAQVEATIQHSRDWSIQVFRDATPSGGHVSVTQWLDSHEFQVFLDEDPSPSEVLIALKWAWKNILPVNVPTGIGWNGEVFHNNGLPWQGTFFTCGKCRHSESCDYLLGAPLSR